MENEKAIKKPSLFTALLLVGLLAGVLALWLNLDFLGKGDDDPRIPLVIVTMVATFLAIRMGHKWKAIEDRMISTISLAMQANIILLTVGMLIASWMVSGTVPSLIYYGLQLISPTWFYVAACIICCVVSLSIGSSWSTAGTVGVALIGISYGLGLNPAIAAGAIISGAYFGDKIAPLSDTTNLAAAMTGTDLFEHIKHLMWTTVPSLLFALILFTIIGFADSGAGSVNQIPGILAALDSAFNITPLALIPLLVIIAVILIKIPPIPGLFCGIATALIIAFLTQSSIYGGFSGLTKTIVDSVQYGYVTEVLEDQAAEEEELVNAAIDALEEAKDEGASAATIAHLENELREVEASAPNYMVYGLVSRGGLEDMLWTISLIIIAMCFGGIMEMAGFLNKIAEAMLKLAKGTGSLMMVSILSCIFMNILCSDQYLSIVIPGRMYRKEFIKRGVKLKNLGRCLEDGATITSPLVPWNTCGAYMSRVLGVPTWQYIWFAFMNYTAPIFGIILGFTKIGGSVPMMTEEEKAEIQAKELAE